MRPQSLRAPVVNSNILPKVRQRSSQTAPSQAQSSDLPEGTRVEEDLSGRSSFGLG